MMHNMIEPRCSAGSLAERALVEAFGKNPSPTMRRFAMKAAHREAQADLPPSARQVRR